MTDEQLAKIKKAADTAILDWFKIRSADAQSLIARLEAAEARAEKLQSAMNMAAAGQPALLLSAYNEGIEAAAKVFDASLGQSSLSISRAIRALKDKP